MKQSSICKTDAHLIVLVRVEPRPRRREICVHLMEESQKNLDGVCKYICTGIYIFINIFISHMHIELHCACNSLFPYMANNIAYISIEFGQLSTMSGKRMATR